MTKKKETTTNKPTRRLLSEFSSSLFRIQSHLLGNLVAFIDNIISKFDDLPGERKVHEAEHSSCQQGDGV